MNTPNNGIVALKQSHTLYHFCCIYSYTELISSDRAFGFFVDKING